jgi:hypothetical protein
MPEDVIGDLKAFTPVIPDRDALLFAAGKAAGRQWVGWKWLTLGLLVSNAANICVLFWPRTVSPVAPVVNPEPSPALPVEPLPPSPFTIEPFSYFALSQGLIAPIAVDSGPSAAQPPLTVRTINDSSMP